MDLDALAARAVSLLRSIFLTLPNLALGLVVLGVAVLVAWLLARTVRAVLHRAGQPAGLQTVLGRLTAWLFVVVALLIAMSFVCPTLNAASVFSALGIGSVAIGFAFRDIFQNLLAGVLILLTRPFAIGDQIVSGDHEGTVEDILIRATFLKTYDGRRVVIPNSELYTNRVVVNTAYDRRRLTVVLGIGIGYGQDLGRARSVILRALGPTDGVLSDPSPEVVVRELGDFSVLTDVRFRVAPPSKRESVVTAGTVLEPLDAAVADSGIDLPYPTQQVLLQRTPPEG